MIIDPPASLTVIDFNRWDYGDPWEEFNRIVWCAQKSHLFATGMVNGYFGGASHGVLGSFWPSTYPATRSPPSIGRCRSARKKSIP